MTKMHNQSSTQDNLLATESWKAEEVLSPSERICEGFQEINDVINGVGDALFVFDAKDLKKDKKGYTN